MIKNISKIFCSFLVLLLVLIPVKSIFALTIGAPVLVSKSTAGVYGDFASQTANISADGRYIVFSSDSTNLVSDDTNGLTDIFLYDDNTDTTIRVSKGVSNTESNGTSTDPDISADGRYIVFASDATNLVAGDTNSQNDIFLYDTQNNTTTRVSVSSLGAQANGHSYYPSISSDGRYVVFIGDTSNTNLVSGDTNNRKDVFLRDTQNDTTTRVSVSSLGAQSNQDSDVANISSDGRYIVFNSVASNLVTGDTNSQYDIFLRDTQNDTTTRVSVSSLGAQANSSSYRPSISADGRYVSFETQASNLVSGDTNVESDIFLRDTQNNTTTRISVSSLGAQGDASSIYSSISSDGRYIVFASDATNLVSSDTNGQTDIFLYDTNTAETTRISVNSLNVESDSSSSVPKISDNSIAIVFQSYATVFDVSDTNSENDIFKVSLVSVSAPTTTTTSSSSITTTTAVLTGNITDTGGESNTVRGFDIGTDTSYTMTDVSETGTYSTGSYSLTATGLTCGTVYHYRAYSTNGTGTGTGSDDTFTTSACPSSSGSSGSSASSRVSNLLNMGKTKEAQEIINQFPNATKNIQTSEISKPRLIKSLKKGTKNNVENVKFIQKVLNLTQDGKFGPKTEKAVKEFQRLHNLIPDGIVGSRTWAVIK